MSALDLHLVGGVDDLGKSEGTVIGCDFGTACAAPRWQGLPAGFPTADSQAVENIYLEFEIAAIVTGIRGAVIAVRGAWATLWRGALGHSAKHALEFDKTWLRRLHYLRGAQQFHGQADAFGFATRLRDGAKFSWDPLTNRFMIRGPNNEIWSYFRVKKVRDAVRAAESPKR